MLVAALVNAHHALKEEKEAVELSLEPYKAQISELETENSILNNQILSLNAENSSLKEQANLNLIKVQEIVNELKEILNKE